MNSFLMKLRNSPFYVIPAGGALLTIFIWESNEKPLCVA